MQINNLDAYYKDKKILEDINLEIVENEILAIIGPSGCGKSTLLNCINGLIYKMQGRAQGQILYKNKNILNDKNLINKYISTVFQEAVAFPFSVKKNIDLVLEYQGIKKNERKSIIEDALNFVGLNDIDKKTNADELSGGQKQRLSIARSIVKKSDILLLDEPCSQLDLNNTKIIEDLLLKLKSQKTIIIVTHNLFQARRIADKVLFLMDKRIVEYNKKDEFFNNPKDMRTKKYLSGQIG